MTYEEDLARLEAIVGELEGEELELDRALALFQEGVERLRSATATLSRAEAEMRTLVERSDGSFTLRAPGG